MNDSQRCCGTLEVVERSIFTSAESAITIGLRVSVPEREEENVSKSIMQCTNGWWNKVQTEKYIIYQFTIDIKALGRLWWPVKYSGEINYIFPKWQVIGMKTVVNLASCPVFTDTIRQCTPCCDIWKFCFFQVQLWITSIQISCPTNTFWWHSSNTKCSFITPAYAPDLDDKQWTVLFSKAMKYIIFGSK